MKDVAQLLNDMVQAGVLLDYAVFGAVAQMRYTEAVATLDADILIAVPSPDRLDVLTPVYEFCRARGYRAEGEAIRVGAWPVQFIPAFDELTAEALKNAETGDFDGAPLRVVSAVYLAVIALGVGRPKDWARIAALLECGAVTAGAVEELSCRHRLLPAWQRFSARFLNA
jgi:hypothetical protein